MSWSTRFLGMTLAAALASGCAGTVFSPHFRDNNLEDLKLSMTGVKPAKQAPFNSTRKHLVFLVTTDPTSILAYDLSANRKLWQVKDDVTSKIIIGHDLIFHRTGTKKLVARRLTSGQQVWSTEIKVGDRLLGLATDGTDLYYVAEHIKRTEEGVAAYLVALKGSSGRTRWIRPSNGRLGAPTALKGRVILPLRSQSLAIVDSNSGVEQARIRSQEEMLLWARDTEAGILFGGKNGVYKLDDKAVTGKSKESSFISATLPGAVRPVYWWDGYNASLAGYTAYDRNRLLWDLHKDKLKFTDDTIYVHNYRFFFAFTANGEKGKPNKLKWVYSFPRHDVVASMLTGKALVMVSANGDLVVLDHHLGVPIAQHQLKVKVRGASFDARGFAPAGKAATKPDLRASLTEVIWDPDRRFGAVKLFAVEQLARLPGESVSADLVKIVIHEKIDPVVYKKAGQMIVDRHDKSAIPFYLTTLKSHYDFLEGTRGKAVDIMARALADLKAKEAVTPLVRHLKDHETPIPAIEEIVKALVHIGDKSAVEPMRDFLLTYRADPLFKKSSIALNLAADGLLKLGGEEERQMLSFVQNDSQTIKPLRAYLAEALKQSK